MRPCHHESQAAIHITNTRQQFQELFFTQTGQSTFCCSYLWQIPDIITLLCLEIRLLGKFPIHMSHISTLCLFADGFPLGAHTITIPVTRPFGIIFGLGNIIRMFCNPFFSGAKV